MTVEEIRLLMLCKTFVLWDQHYFWMDKGMPNVVVELLVLAVVTKVEY